MQALNRKDSLEEDFGNIGASVKDLKQNQEEDEVSQMGKTVKSLKSNSTQQNRIQQITANLLEQSKKQVYDKE